MVCYIEQLNVDNKIKNNLQAQHEFYYNNLLDREGFLSTVTEDNKKVIEVTDIGKDYLRSQNNEIGKVYGIQELPIQSNNKIEVKEVATINVLNLNEIEVKPLAIYDYLEEISLKGNSYNKDLATILKAYSFNKDIRLVTKLDKNESENYFGKITPNEILIDKEFIESEAVKNNLNPTDEFHRILQHEFLHELTIQNIKNNPKLQVKLEELLLITEEESYKLGYTKANAFLDVYEFVAEVFSDPHLQKVMKKIPYQSGSLTHWDKFIEIINSYLKKLGFVDYSVLDEVLNLNKELFKKEPTIKSIKELLEQDSNLSPTQLSDSLRLEYSKVAKKYNYDTEAIVNNLDLSNVVFEQAHTRNVNGVEEKIGLYYYKDETPNFKSLRKNKEDSIQSLIDEYEIINTDNTISNEVLELTKINLKNSFDILDAEVLKEFNIINKEYIDRLNQEEIDKLIKTICK